MVTSAGGTGHGSPRSSGLVSSVRAPAPAYQPRRCTVTRNRPAGLTATWKSTVSPGATLGVEAYPWI
ncbi:hypothetical protein ACIA5A_25535 [Micromonospora sp. NPDC051300]|uniref:hypothetical protein n=1 Tax=Micromonospora sp. NPDC051300 TaxID=3364286 RepID=UPI0037A07DC5